MLITTVKCMKNDILTVSPYGALKSKEEVFDFVDFFSSKALEKGVKKVLIDESQLKVELTPLDVVEITETLHQQGHQSVHLKIATVGPTNIGLSQIAEMSAADRSMDYKPHSQKAKAIRWLMEN